MREYKCIVLITVVNHMVEIIVRQRRCEPVDLNSDPEFVEKRENYAEHESEQIQAPRFGERLAAVEQTTS